MGVRVYRGKVIAFVIAAVTCGLAGAMVAQQNQYINSDFISFQLSIFILLLVLFGGAGTKLGPVVGAIVLTLLDALLARWPSVQHTLYGLLLLFALYVMPGGVVGTLSKLVGRKSQDTKEEYAAPGGQVTTLLRGGRSNGGELLTVTKLSKAYGGVKPAQDISFALKRGHIHALIGRMVPERAR